jgi:FOG: TPR repeat
VSPDANDPQRLGPDASRSIRALLIGLALAAGVLAVFAPVRHYELGDFDDRAYVGANAHVAQGLTWQGVAWAFTTTQEANWHPLAWLSHMADVELYGADLGKHHLTNVLLHVINTLLLFGLLLRATRAIGPSAFVAALFGVHPLHVEPVAWIAERKELLCTFFGLLAIGAYVHYARRPSARRYLLVMILFALGLMAKPMLVTLPFVLLLLDVWPLGRAPGFPTLATAAPATATTAWPRLLREKLPLLALTLASSAVTFVVQRNGGAVASMDALPLPLRLSDAAVSYVKYLGKTIWPTRLAILYPHPRSFSGSEVLGAVLLLIGISALLVRAARQRPYLLVGWLWYLGTLVPVIGLVQVGSQSMADRYTYVPLIGLFIMVAWGASDLIARWPHRESLLRAGALLAIVACAVAARAQLGHWQDTVTVWSHALAVTNDNARAHNNLGVALALTGRSDEAFAHYLEAVRIDPEYADAQYNLGNQLLEKQRAAEACLHYSEAIRIQPDFARAHFGLAVCLAAEGKLAHAVREMMSAVELEPENADFHYNLAVLLVRQGRRSAAAKHLETAVRLDPDDYAARRELDLLRSEAAPPR